MSKCLLGVLLARLGDADTTHVVQPPDTKMLAKVALALIRAVPRPINWLHFPVPSNREDDAYFEPLARIIPEIAQTEVYLGLVHEHDLEGTVRRLQTAQRYISKFGVATECGLRRRTEKDLDSVLEIMGEL